MQKLNVLAIQRISAEDRAKIEAVDPSVALTDAGGWYDGEIRETWPAFTVARYLAPGATGAGTREERDRLLSEAEIILGGWPFPLDLRKRAPRLKWFHQRPAGASNLLLGDLWGSHVVVTTSRGLGNNLAMAEYALAGILHFAKGLHRAAVDRGAGAFDHRAYRPLLVEGKTACVVGAGGIGLDVGKLCAALGMRVVGTRRQAQPDRPLPAGFSELGGAERSRPVLAAERFRGDLLPMDAGDDPSVRQGPLRGDEAGERARQCRARRDRRRGGAGRRTRARSFARRGARCLCRRIRAHADVTVVVRSEGADYAAYLRPPAIRTVMAPPICSATTCAPISTARRSAMSSIGSGAIRHG